MGWRWLVERKTGTVELRFRGTASFAHRSYSQTLTGYRFQATQKLETPEEITMAIYRATVEVFLAASAEESLTELGEPRDGALVTVAKDVRIKVESGNVRLEFPKADTIQKLVASIRRQPEGIESAVFGQPKARNYTRGSLQKDLQALGREWLHVPLTNTAIKFAVSIRVNYVELQYVIADIC
jgi:hypothetical protein